jgi:glutaredoxin
VLCRRTAERPGRPLILGILAGGFLFATVAGATVYRLRTERVEGEPAVSIAPALAPATVRADETRRASGRLPDVHVVVYTTSWCPVCKRAKQWMNARGVAYEEHDVEASSESARQMRAINPRGGVPTFDVEGQVEVGFSADDLTATMQRAAVRRAM